MLSQLKSLPAEAPGPVLQATAPNSRFGYCPSQHSSQSRNRESNSLNPPTGILQVLDRFRVITTTNLGQQNHHRRPPQLSQGGSKHTSDEILENSQDEDDLNGSDMYYDEDNGGDYNYEDDSEGHEYQSGGHDEGDEGGDYDDEGSGYRSGDGNDDDNMEYEDDTMVLERGSNIEFGVAPLADIGQSFLYFVEG